PTMVRLKEELETLNLFIERLTVLRKELSESQELMWVRHKGKLFRRLSKLGDQLFALRKEKMETMARLYEEAVDNFVSTNFPNNVPKGPHKNLIREIQRLQAISRVLMHSDVYRRTRLKLSACWDRIRESEKEKKAEDEQNRVKYAENLAPFLEKVETLDKEFQEGKKDVAACHEEMKKIERESQSKELGFREKKELKQRLFQMKRVIDQRLEKEREAAQKQHQLNEEKRKETFDKFCQKVEEVIQKGEQLDEQKEVLEQEVGTLKLTKTEKLFVQRLMNQLKEKIISQHEAALLQLPDDQKQALDQLKTLLDEKQEWRQQIKSEVDALKKLNSGSGLDFEKAIEIRQLLDEEEHKLITIDEAIADIEQRISTIKQNHR
ncbi:MAG: hypothetical protein KDK65_00075, partial [Chlamydiia bacterium]|nr:hypothetical protein [Chlamydiia bacterium]